MQGKKTLDVFLSVAVSILLWGCGKAPLEKGINGYLASLNQCITVAASWPQKVAVGTNTYTRLESFVDAGLLKVESAGNLASFEPTSEGSAVFVTKDNAQKLCLPAPAVVKVIRETPIKESGKDAVTEVEYTFSVNDVPAWAKNEKVKKAFAVISEIADGQVHSGSGFFHETANGWEVVRGDNAKFFGEKMKPMRPM